MEFLDILIYGVAVILSFYYRDKLKGSVLKYLPYFLLFDLIVGLVSILINVSFKLYNVWLINILVNMELLFLFWLYYHLFKNHKYKKYTLIMAIVYESVYISGIYLSDSWNNYLEFPFFIGSLFMIIILMLFILEMLSSDDFLYIHKYTVFWITVAYLFYLIIPFPLSFWTYLFYKYDSTYLMQLYPTIQTIANLMMYFTLIFGFIWSKKRYK